MSRMSEAHIESQEYEERLQLDSSYLEWCEQESMKDVINQAAAMDEKQYARLEESLKG